MKPDWFEDLPATKTVLKWTVRIAFMLIGGVIIFYQWRDAQVNRVRTIEQVQEVQQLDISEIKNEFKGLEDRTEELLKEQTDKIIEIIQDNTRQTDKKLELLIKYREMDKEMLIDMLSLSRKSTEPVAEKPEISIGVRKK